MTGPLCHPQHLASAPGPRAAAAVVALSSKQEVGKENSRHASKALIPKSRTYFFAHPIGLSLFMSLQVSAREAGKCHGATMYWYHSEIACAQLKTARHWG